MIRKRWARVFKEPLTTLLVLQLYLAQRTSGGASDGASPGCDSPRRCGGRATANMRFSSPCSRASISAHGGVALSMKTADRRGSCSDVTFAARDR